MLKVLKVKSSGYYYWLKHPESKCEKRNRELIKDIRRIYEGSRKVYGSPRITKRLNTEGIRISRPRVARLMKKEGIRSITKRKYRITTDSSHGYALAENLLQRDFSAGTLGQKWVSDITYIKTGEGWLYLTMIMDLADRKM